MERTTRSPLARTPGGLLNLLLVLAWVSTAHAYMQPFQPVETGAVVAKRQACLANFFSCANQGAAFSNICCQNGQKCALDEKGSPACCPSG